MNYNSLSEEGQIFLKAVNHLYGYLGDVEGAITIKNSDKDLIQHLSLNDRIRYGRYARACIFNNTPLPPDFPEDLKAFVEETIRGFVVDHSDQRADFMEIYDHIQNEIEHPHPNYHNNSSAQGGRRKTRGKKQHRRKVGRSRKVRKTHRRRR